MSSFPFLFFYYLPTPFIHFYSPSTAISKIAEQTNSSIMKIEHSILVQNPLNEVFSHVSNLQGGKEIIDFTNIFYQTSKTKIGTKYTRVLNILGNNWKSKLEVTSFINNQEIKAKSVNGSLPMEESLELHKEKDGIRVSWKVRIQPKGASKLLSPVIKNNINNQVRYKINELKEKLDFSFMKQTTLAFASQNDRFWL